MSRFREGDVCVVTNNDYKGGHPYPKGTVVTLITVDYKTWQCQDAHGEKWWVEEGCLELADQGPSDDEVLALFGIKPETTVVDFLRQLRDDPGMPTNFRADIDQFLFETLGVKDE